MLHDSCATSARRSARTVVDVRRLVEGLRPPALDELGLAGACAQAVERLTASAGLTASVNARDGLPALVAAVEVAAYRIVVEAVTNAVRHAGARHCQVSIDHSEAALELAITDDGAGLRPPDHHGHGLAIMRSRPRNSAARLRSPTPHQVSR